MATRLRIIYQDNAGRHVGAKKVLEYLERLRGARSAKKRMLDKIFDLHKQLGYLGLLNIWKESRGCRKFSPYVLMQPPKQVIKKKRFKKSDVIQYRLITNVDEANVDETIYNFARPNFDWLRRRVDER